MDAEDDGAKNGLIELFLADPDAPDYRRWNGEMHDALGRLLVVIDEVRSIAKRYTHGDAWWKRTTVVERHEELLGLARRIIVNGNRPGWDVATSYLATVIARMERAKDERAMSAVRILGGDPPPNHPAPMGLALAALLEAAETIAVRWPKPRAQRRGHNDDHERRRREGIALARWLRARGHEIEPANFALAAIAVGVEGPTTSTHEFEARRRRWRTWLSRARRPRS